MPESLTTLSHMSVSNISPRRGRKGRWLLISLLFLGGTPMAACVALVVVLEQPYWFVWLTHYPYCAHNGHMREIMYAEANAIPAQLPAKVGGRGSFYGTEYIAFPIIEPAIEHRGKPRIFNFVAFQDCRVERKYGGQLEVAELRDPWLTEMIRGKDLVRGSAMSWATRREPWFRRAALTAKLQNLPYDNSTPIGHAWEFTQRRLVRQDAPPLPAWFPLHRLQPEHFVGVLGSGFFFEGADADQYFWVAVR